jgi:cytoskeleton protein RodZ
VGVIGDTLFEARTRRGVDLEQIEAATGIRPRYLRAIEEEDWEALPEEFYARSFIRKYAQFVGVDPEPLVDEYKRQRGTGGRGAAPTSPFAQATSRRAEALRRRRKRQAVYAWGLAAVLLAAVVVAVVLISSGGGGSSGSGSGSGEVGKAGAPRSKPHGHQRRPTGGAPAKTSRRFPRPKSVKLRVEPTAKVWACVENAKGKRVVDGATLAAGEAAGPFTSRSFTAAFGNGSVELWPDGKRAATPSSPSPIGFTVDRDGKVRQLPEGRRPSCE